jgi:hypothetical protein
VRIDVEQKQEKGDADLAGPQGESREERREGMID